MEPTTLHNQSSITDNVVSTIYKDSLGFLWIGKMDGLYKYNGYSSEVFTIANGISHLWVTAFMDQGNFFVVGTKNGVNFLSKKNQTFNRFFFSDLNSGYSDEIRCGIVVKHKLFIGTSNELLQIVIDKEKKLEALKIDFFENVTKVKNLAVNQLIDTGDGILINTSRGLFILPYYQSKAIKIDFSLDKGNKLLNFNSLYLTQSKNLLLASNENVYYTNIAENSFLEHRKIELKPISELYNNWPISSIVTTFLEDSNKNLWIGTEGEGLFFFQNKTKQWQNYRYKINLANVLKNDFIRTLYEDKNGMIVIGSDAGINTIITREKKFQFINKVYNKTSKRTEEIINVHAIVEDKKRNLWIGTRGKGLFVYNENSVINISPKINPSLGHIRSIIKDKSGSIWLGSQQGIYVIDDLMDGEKTLSNYFKKNTPTLLHNNYIYTILEDNSNNKWISTDDGLYVYTANKTLKKITNTYAHSSLDKKIVYSIFLDSKNRLWFGTLNGFIAYLNPADYTKYLLNQQYYGKTLDFKIIRYTKKDESILQNYDTYTFGQIGNDSILAGTNFGLLSIDIKNKTITPFLSKDKKFGAEKIRDGYIYGLLYSEIEDKLWISSSNGLSSFDLTSSIVENHSQKDGLQSLEFNGNATYKNEKGHLYFGGANGLNIYNPNSTYKKSNFQPKLVLTQLFINGKRIPIMAESNILNQDIPITKNLVLSAEQNTIGFEFAALDLPYPKDNLYKCKLVGVDDDWVNLNNKRSINYANIPPGHYTFQLMGTNNDGVWSPNTLNVPIQILPQWYETWYMMTVWCLLIMGIITSFTMILLKNRNKNNELKIKEIEHNNLESLYESKLVFFTNISHELRTPLSLIIDPIKSLTQQKSVYNQNKELFDLVRNNVERLHRLVDQILDFRKHEYGKIELDITKSDIVKTLHNITLDFVYQSEIKNITYKTKLPDGPIHMYYDMDKVEKVVYNILSNAFKATPNGGKIKVSMGMVKNKHRFQKYKVVCGPDNPSGLKNHIYIKVDDNGIGVSPDQVEEIFTRFYQDGSVNSGTGIGLYIVKQLTEMHYGSILIKSAKNKGTSFIVLLPKNDDLYESKEISSTQKPENGYTALYNTGSATDIVEPKKTQTIVIVEDNDELRIYLKNILQNDYKVLSAQNGLEGFELIKEEVPDVVVSDIIMPESDGIGLCKKLKENFDTSHIPVILLTAKSFDHQIVEGINSGADVYLTKPFSKEVLLANIKNLIGGREKLRLIFQNENILEPSKITVTSIDEKFIHKLKEAVEANIQDQQMSLDSLASQLGVSRAQLFRKVKALTGLTPNNFIKSIRIKYAAELLKDERFQMSEVAFLSGFNEASYFSRCFKEAYGCSPKEYRKSIEL